MKKTNPTTNAAKRNRPLCDLHTRKIVPEEGARGRNSIRCKAQRERPCEAFINSQQRHEGLRSCLLRGGL